MRKFYSPERLIEELGITEPNEIDVDAIAYYCGALVKYRPLDGCEARITGLDDKAIITVNSNSRLERQRFSVGHELGHWMRDRGKVGNLCQKSDLHADYKTQKNSEAAANEFAANLLMPKSIFRQHLLKQSMTFATADKLGESFSTSRTATAIRMVELGPPAIIAAYNRQGRQWFHRGPDVPEILWPQETLQPDSEAHDLLFKDKESSRPTMVPADLWVTHRSSGDYEVTEHSVKSGSDEVLTLIWWKDESQIIDLQ